MWASHCAGFSLHRTSSVVVAQGLSCQAGLDREVRIPKEKEKAKGKRQMASGKLSTTTFLCSGGVCFKSYVVMATV